MSIRDEIIASTDMRRVEKCKLARWVDEQDNADEWQEYLADPTLKASGIAVVMTKYGYEGAPDGIRITSPEHGPTIHAPVHVQDRKAEGW